MNYLDHNVVNCAPNVNNFKVDNLTESQEESINNNPSNPLNPLNPLNSDDAPDQLVKNKVNSDKSQLNEIYQLKIKVLKDSGLITVIDENANLETDFFPKLSQLGTLFELHPKVAAKILETYNKLNRRPSNPYIKKMTDEINDGAWDYLVKDILFDVNNQLIDGQHRLNAQVLANVPLTFLIRGKLPTDIFHKSDIGKSRNNGDAINIYEAQSAGQNNTTKNKNLVAAVIKRVYFYQLEGQFKIGSITSKDINNRKIIELYQSMPNIHEYIKDISHNKSYRGLGTQSILATLYYLASTIDKVKAKSFFEALAKGSNLAEDSPIFMARTLLVSKRLEKIQSAEYEMIISIIITEAFNSYMGYKVWDGKVKRKSAINKQKICFLIGPDVIPAIETNHLIDKCLENNINNSVANNIDTK